MRWILSSRSHLLPGGGRVWGVSSALVQILLSWNRAFPARGRDLFRRRTSADSTVTSSVSLWLPLLDYRSFLWEGSFGRSRRSFSFLQLLKGSVDHPRAIQSEESLIYRGCCWVTSQERCPGGWRLEVPHLHPAPFSMEAVGSKEFSFVCAYLRTGCLPSCSRFPCQRDSSWMQTGCFFFIQGERFTVTDVLPETSLHSRTPVGRGGALSRGFFG